MSQAIYTPSISNIEEHEPDKKADFYDRAVVTGLRHDFG